MSTPGWDRQRTYKGEPHGWIQWKGTSVCMDCYCKCGHHFHIDDDFSYYVQCPECDAIWMANGHIELVELTPEEQREVIDKNMALSRDPDGEQEKWAKDGYPGTGPRR